MVDRFTILDIGTINQELPALYGLFDSLRQYVNYFDYLPLMPVIFFSSIFVCISFGMHEYFGNKLGVKKYFIFTNIFISFFALCLMSIIFQITHDDAFMSLVHSKNLLMGRGFSYSSAYLVEGTPETLFYFIVGLLGHTGVSIEIIALILSFIFGIGCLVLIYFIIFELTSSFIYGTIGLFLISVNCSFAMSVLSMFGATMSGFIFLLAVFLSIRGRFLSSLICTALLPLANIDYLIFVFMVSIIYFCFIFFDKGSKFTFRIFMHQFVLLFPAIALIIWRYIYFTSLLPLAGFNKNFIIDNEIILEGLSNFLRYSHQQPIGLGILSIIIILIYDNIIVPSPKQKGSLSISLKNKNFPLVFFFVTFFLFSGSYLFNAFETPLPSWFIQFLPLTLLIYALSVILIFNVIKIFMEVFCKYKTISQKKIIILKSLLCFCFIMMIFVGYRGLFKDRVMAYEWNKKSRTFFYWSEIINKISPLNFVVGTTELGALAFFTDIKILDLTGRFNSNSDIKHLMNSLDIIKIEKPELVSPIAIEVLTSDIKRYISDLTSYKYLGDSLIKNKSGNYYDNFEDIFINYNPVFIIGNMGDKSMIVHLLVRKDLEVNSAEINNITEGVFLK